MMPINIYALRSSNYGGRITHPIHRVTQWYILNYWLCPCIILLFALQHVAPSLFSSSSCSPSFSISILFWSKPIYYFWFCASHCVKTTNSPQSEWGNKAAAIFSNWEAYGYFFSFFFEYHKYLLLPKQHPHINMEYVSPLLLAIKFDLLIVVGLFFSFFSRSHIWMNFGELIFVYSKNNREQQKKKNHSVSRLCFIHADEALVLHRFSCFLVVLLLYRLCCWKKKRWCCCDNKYTITRLIAPLCSARVRLDHEPIENGHGITGDIGMRRSE